MKACVVPSRFLGQKFLDCGLDPAKLTIIPYGIDLEKVDRAKEVDGMKEDAVIRILHAGRLVPKKGILDLIRAFGQIMTTKHIELVIVGDGTQRKEAEELSLAMGLTDRVRFLGVQPHEVVLSYMKLCEIYVLNSRTDENQETEGFPNTI